MHQQTSFQCGRTRRRRRRRPSVGRQQQNGNDYATSAPFSCSHGVHAWHRHVCGHVTTRRSPFSVRVSVEHVAEREKGGGLAVVETICISRTCFVCGTRHCSSRVCVNVCVSVHRGDYEHTLLVWHAHASRGCCHMCVFGVSHIQRTGLWQRIAIRKALTNCGLVAVVSAHTLTRRDHLAFAIIARAERRS